MKISTTGASAVTARQDRLEPGVAASEKMAQIDVERMRRYTGIISRAAQQCDVDPALIAGIISRESRAGNQLDNGWGDNGKAWGLMQVDVTPNGGGHTPVGNWDSLEHLVQATNILVYFIGRIRDKFPTWDANQHLKGAIAAYNMGDGNVEPGKDVDANTTGGDYSNDVVARAKWYKRNLSF
ncbi:unnamed protein product [Tetraodon nigroviridis]|uniref:Lysozyme g n=1 Tax=Tetraodon nigroviridis TaxID=99883 RepID=Q4RZR7_TETNG|nr:unnamed protein product [Tetraodon nigroviridis]